MTKTKFNSEQLLAIHFHKGSCGVVSAAGSGKSTILVNRIKNLIEVHNERQQDILAISFTRNTADELKKKLSKMGYSDVNVGTFHSICGRILSQEGIYITGNKLVAEWQYDNCFKAIDPKADKDDIISFISYQKNYLKGYNDTFMPKETNYDEVSLRKFFKAYEDMKKKQGLYDFDDYLLLCLDLLQNNKGKYTYEFILVDEHQDSNMVQNLILQELCQSGNLFACYDVRQAIYSWRAGNIEYSMNFDRYWNNPTIINMFINYRSTNNIVQKANKFIKPYFKDYEHYVDSEAHNKSDGEITLHTYTEREVEGVDVADRIEELISKGEKLNEIAVLYRLNSHSSFVENELKLRGIEYEITNDSSFFKRTEIKGIINYLRLLHNPHDDSAFEGVFNMRCYPLKFMSKNVLNDAKKYSGENNMSLYEAFINMRYAKPFQQKAVVDFENTFNRVKLQLDKNVSVISLIGNIVKSFQIESFIYDKYSSKEEIEDRINSIEVLKSFVKGNNMEQFISYVYSNNTKKKSKKDSVKLMSIHSSKGLEWDFTFIIGIEDEKFPHIKSSVDEEARLFYVGITRAKKNLYLSQIGESQFAMEYMR